MSSPQSASKGDSGRRAYSIDWPTIGLAVIIYSAFLVTTYFHASIPWWLLLPMGAIIVGIHGSLQHEAVHGYPTRWPLANLLVAGWALWLWLPYGSYRRLHLQHHIDEQLTDPLRDPESNYVTAAQWGRDGQVPSHHPHGDGQPRRALHHRTDLFRRHELHRARRGAAPPRPPHPDALVSGMSSPWRAILFWVLWVCDMPFWQYVLFFAYPGTSMALVRSYRRASLGAEPQPPQRGHRVGAVLEHPVPLQQPPRPASPGAGPGLVAAPARYREIREELLAANGGYLIKGYGELARRHLLHAQRAPAPPRPGAVTLPGVRASTCPIAACGGIRPRHES